MKKITETQRVMLNHIYAVGGSYCPDTDLDPLGWRALNDLVKAKRLSVETYDGSPPRFNMTAQGHAEVDHG